MLPVRVRTARVLYGAGVELYRLGKDDTEGKVENGDFEDTESLYGVEKPAWEAFITSEKGKAYLTAWHNVVESASKVVNDEMSYLDGAYNGSLVNGAFVCARRASEFSGKGYRNISCVLLSSRHYPGICYGNIVARSV